MFRGFGEGPGHGQCGFPTVVLPTDELSIQPFPIPNSPSFSALQLFASAERLVSVLSVQPVGYGPEPYVTVSKN